VHQLAERLLGWRWRIGEAVYHQQDETGRNKSRCEVSKICLN
jgi:hypothetical protein